MNEDEMESASPEVYAFLEAEDYGYVIRLPANAVLQRRIAHLPRKRASEQSIWGMSVHTSTTREREEKRS